MSPSVNEAGMSWCTHQGPRAVYNAIVPCEGSLGLTTDMDWRRVLFG